MPESPVSKAKAFSAAPEGKTSMTMEELKRSMDTQLQDAAAVLGAKVITEEPETQEAPVDTVPIDEEDKRRYIRSLLAKEQFIKSYDLFGGMLKATFRTRKVQENDVILAQFLDKERFRARLACSTVSVTLGASKEPVSLDTLDDIAHAAVADSFKHFEELCDELFRRANDPDFWTGIAGRT